MIVENSKDRDVTRILEGQPKRRGKSPTATPKLSEQARRILEITRTRKVDWQSVLAKEPELAPYVAEAMQYAAVLAAADGQPQPSRQQTGHGCGFVSVISLF